jgi:VIT1/CCC1 family predicted Fe2+/Mn2+ transporter
MPVEPAWSEYYRDEMDAAWLYRALARVEANPQRRAIFDNLAKVEDEHVERWRALFHEHGGDVPPHSPSFRSRMLAAVARLLGSGSVLPLIIAEESREVGSYLRLARGATDKATHDTAVAIATESAEHAQHLSSSIGREGEPWHGQAAGGYLRSVVYGFNDGLTANFGLVAGVIGAQTAQTQHTVIVAGIAGLIADALSMGSSGYLAAKSEAEVYANEIAMERDEIALMPEVERDELAILYEAKGMTPESAHALATEVMANPAQMLEEQVKGELGISDPHMSPMREAWITGSATAIGALIPVVPFLVWSGTTAIVASFAISMLSHWLVGAARSVFTGRSVFRSGLDMFVVGLGVALVAYFVGDWVAAALR